MRNTQVFHPIHGTESPFPLPLGKIPPWCFALGPTSCFLLGFSPKIGAAWGCGCTVLRDVELEVRGLGGEGGKR